MTDIKDALVNGSLREQDIHVRNINESGMKKLVVVAPGGRVVCEICHLADKPHTRLRGIIGWKRAYYAENLERLVATKHAVDPANRFRHAQSIPTAL